MRKFCSSFEGNSFSRLFRLKHGFLSLVCMIVGLSGLTSCEREEPAAAPLSNSRTDNNYELGSVIHFGIGGGSERFRQSGWSDTEKQFTWSIGNSAKLLLIVPSTDQPLHLRMRLTGFIKLPELPSQPVEVFANGQKIAEWTVAGTADYEAMIPARAIKGGGALTIELKTPKAAVPKSLGVNEDARVLGVLCSELAITQGD